MRLGPDAALTGPVQRGDVATVKAHLAALAQTPESIRALYRAAAAHALAVAERQGLAAAPAAELRKVLEEEDRR